MSNIPYLAARREKRSGKVESFDIIKKLINDENISDIDLATLYSYFLPPKLKKITNVFDWLTLPCDNKSSYAFCKYIYTHSGCVQSANTSVAHIVFNDLGFDDGCWYDVQKGNVGDDVAIMPDIFDALSNAQKDGVFLNFNIEHLDIKDTTKGLCYILPWNGKGVDKQYFDIMYKSLDSIVVTYSNDGAFVVSGTVNKHQSAAIIMPYTVVEI